MFYCTSKAWTTKSRRGRGRDGEGQVDRGNVRQRKRSGKRGWQTEKQKVRDGSIFLLLYKVIPVCLAKANSKIYNQPPGTPGLPSFSSPLLALSHPCKDKGWPCNENRKHSNPKIPLWALALSFDQCKPSNTYENKWGTSGAKPGKLRVCTRVYVLARRREGGMK